MEGSLSPVFLDIDEHVKLPEGPRIAVRIDDDESSPTIGLCCAFCRRYYTDLSSTSTLGVVQVQVSNDGEEYKRWGGADLVWQCSRCLFLKRSVTFDGRKIVKGRIPEVTETHIKKRIGDTVYGIVQNTRW